MTITCEQTGKTVEAKTRENGEAKLPRGWKRIGEKTYSPEGRAELFFTRVIFLPILKPLGKFNGDDLLPLDWKEFGNGLREAWNETADIGNMILRSLFLVEKPVDKTDPKKHKLGKFEPPKDLYNAVRTEYPQFSTGSLTQLMQTVSAQYSKRRFEMLITKKISLPSYRGGALAIPVKGGTWQPILADGELKIALRIGSTDASGIRGSRVLVLLRQNNHREHAAILKRVIAGEIESADLKIVKTKDGAAVAITVFLPKKITVKSETAMEVSTAKDALLIWKISGSDQSHPPLHFEQLRELLAARKRNNQARSDDMKFEKRWPADRRKRMVHSWNLASRIMQNRIDSAILDAVNLTVRFAIRRNCKTIIYDDSCRDFAEKFAWHELKSRLQNAADKNGITMIDAPAKAGADSPAARVEGDQGPAHKSRVQPPKESPEQSGGV